MRDFIRNFTPVRLRLKLIMHTWHFSVEGATALGLLRGFTSSLIIPLLASSFLKLRISIIRITPSNSNLRNQNIVVFLIVKYFYPESDNLEFASLSLDNFLS